MKFTLVIPEKGILYTPGINWGYKYDPLSIIGENPNYLILKTKGTTDWSGLGESSYFPTKYLFCQIIDQQKEEKDRRLFILELADFEFGRQWKKGIRLLQEALHNINNENQETVIKHLKEQFNPK